jgi:hypothetical protein
MADTLSNEDNDCVSVKDMLESNIDDFELFKEKALSGDYVFPIIYD